MWHNFDIFFILKDSKEFSKGLTILYEKFIISFAFECLSFRSFNMKINALHAYTRLVQFFGLSIA